MKHAVFAFIALLLMLATVNAVTQTVPQSINYQGRLAKPDGTPVPDITAQPLTFRLFDGSGSKLWEQTLPNVTVHNGAFAVPLDFSNAGGHYIGASNQASVFANPLFTPSLEIQVGSAAPLAPRQPLASVAYGLYAGTALSVSNGGVTDASIAAGTITADKFSPGVFNPIAWLLGGNSGTNPATNFLGTTDNQPLVIKVNGHQAMRYSYAENTVNAGYEYRSVNTLGGSEINSIAAGVTGATIAGGGKDYFTGADFPNTVNADFGTVSGGYGNMANFDATVGGGYSNTASSPYGTIAGGANNTASGGFWTTVGGGDGNTASNGGATVSGGNYNVASGSNATVSGGYASTASGIGATIAGGPYNTAAGYCSFAAGQQAQANHDGSFVWNDSSSPYFSISGSPTHNYFVSTAPNQFLIHATGGVGIGTNSPSALLSLSGSDATGNGSAASLKLSNAAAGGGNWSLRAGATGTNTPAGGFSIGNDNAYWLTISGSGNVGVGFNSTRPQYPLDVVGDINTSGNVRVGGVIKIASDARYKTHIVTLNNALDDVLSLRGVTYDWDRAKWPEKNFSDSRQIGFIAQEIEKIFPELVSADSNGYRSVNYIGVVPVLVEAVKTLNTKLDDKQKQIDALRADNAELKKQNARIADLEKQFAAFAAAQKQAQDDRRK